MPTLVNRRVVSTDPWLIPGCHIDQPIRNIQHGTVVVGHTFETITTYAFKAERLSNDTSFGLNPDIMCGDDFLESKAFGPRHRASGQAMLSLSQLNSYLNVRSEHSTKYVFWRYRYRRPLLPTADSVPSMREVVERISSTIQYAMVIDAPILKRVADGCVGTWGVKKRTQVDYRRNHKLTEFLILSDSTFHMLENIEHQDWFLKALQMKPDEVKSSTRKRRINFQVDGVDFCTNYFDLCHVTDAVPF